MAKLKNMEMCWVNGNKLLEAIHYRGYSTVEFAKLCKFSCQTIMNYLSSVPLAPKRVKLSYVEKMAKILEVEVESLCFTDAEVERFVPPFGVEFFRWTPTGPVDAEHTLTVEGKWQVVAELTGDSKLIADWSEPYTMEVKQSDSTFIAELISNLSGTPDKENIPSECQIRGYTLEGGAYVMLQYSFQTKSMRIYGFALLTHHGDRMTGSFIGRNSRLGDQILTGGVHCERLRSHRKSSLPR